MEPQPVLVRSPWNDPYIEREREIVGILPENGLFDIYSNETFSKTAEAAWSATCFKTCLSN